MRQLNQSLVNFSSSLIIFQIIFGITSSVLKFLYGSLFARYIDREIIPITYRYFRRLLNLNLDTLLVSVFDKRVTLKPMNVLNENTSIVIASDT